jgi:hypothetical protein
VISSRSISYGNMCHLKENIFHINYDVTFLEVFENELCNLLKHQSSLPKLMKYHKMYSFLK